MPQPVKKDETPSQPMEQTLVLVKPDGISKSLTGNILTKISEAKLKIIGAKVVRVSEALAEEHYKSLKDKPFFKDLIKYILGSYHNENRVLAMVYYGPEAIRRVRTIAGATNPEEADPVSIRGAYGRITTKGVYENVIHASSDMSESEREIKLWFNPEDLAEPIYPSKKTVKEKIEVLEWA
jgi:nucleoside-diphosphate kinase